MANTPSGVTVDKPGNVYVSVREGARGVIWKYAPDGTASWFKDIGEATIYGLAATPNGDVYAAMAAPGSDRGIYRVDRKGNVERLPGTAQIILANGLAFDDRGNLYVTESFSGSPASPGEGGIWRIPPGGAAEALAARSPADRDWPAEQSPHGRQRHRLLPRRADRVEHRQAHCCCGSRSPGTAAAGTPAVWKVLEDVPESRLAGSAFPIMPDGLALDVHGNVYLTILTRNAVVRVMAGDGTQESVAVFGSLGPGPSAPFDTPASLAFGTGAREQQNLFVTNLGWMARFPIPVPPLGWPGPALVKVPAGAPGRPL